MTRKELFGTMVGNVTNFTGTAGNGQITLKWTDPEDTVYEEVPLVWAGTRVLRKEGSYPVDENDGTIVVNSTLRNQYSSSGFVDTGLSNGTKYYYQAFPYTIIYNLNDENRISITPSDAFVTTWNMTAGIFTLPTQVGTYNATIDWGDGSVLTQHTTGNPTHIYAVAGKYTISIRGQYNGLNCSLNRPEGSEGYKLISVDNWGDVGFISFEFAFYFCRNLISLPNGAISGVENVTSFYHCFYSCTSLTSIPSGLFDNCRNVTSFSSCFYSCISLTLIPDNLFSNCINVTTFEDCFNGCTHINYIPNNLLNNCINVTSFQTCFKNCTHITSVPAGLFSNCINVTNFNACFYNCISLASIPNELFKFNINVTTFYYCFEGCNNLQLPEIIFDLIALQNKKPDFTHCFHTNLTTQSHTGAVQPIWDYITITYGNSCFHNCTSLTNYSSIPALWK